MVIEHVVLVNVVLVNNLCSGCRIWLMAIVLSRLCTTNFPTYQAIAAGLGINVVVPSPTLPVNDTLLFVSTGPEFYWFQPLVALMGFCLAQSADHD